MKNRISDDMLGGCCISKKNISNRYGFIWSGWILVFIFTLVIPSFAKFMVRPLKVELSARPGNTAEEMVELRNLEADRFRILDLRLVELTQTEDGGWEIVETEPNVDTTNPYSCLEWMKLSANSVRIEPLGMKQIALKIKAHPRGRGFYYAGLTIQTRPALNTKGIPVVARILVPVIFEVQSRAVRQKINLTDIGMELRLRIGEKRATTLLTVSVANEGRTYSRLRGKAKVQNFVGGYWRDITKVTYREVGILPGINLKLKGDIERSLPSGKYKLKGSLYVDGRRTKPIEKEIDFTGDPNSTGVSADTVLELEPTNISIVGVPRSRRSAVLKVRNPSDSDITVRGGIVTPTALQNVAFGELQGGDLVCAKWMKVEPANFTVRPGRQQNIRVTAEMPEAEKMYANYYANLGLWSKYPDGQNAGVIISPINVQNKKIKIKPEIQPMKISVAVDEKSMYAVTGRFGNIGNVHVSPRCSAILMTAEGRIARRTAMTGETELMLPLEVRNFSGLINFGMIPPGMYRLEMALEYITDDGIVDQASKGVNIRVTVGDNNHRIVEVVNSHGAKS